MKRLILGITLGAAIVCASWVVFTGQFQIAQAKDAVRAAMKDPESVTFSKVRFLRASGAVCGSFNAKNSYGGYVGALQFVRTSDGRVFRAPQGKTQIDTARLERLKKEDPFKAYEESRTVLKKAEAEYASVKMIVDLCEADNGT